MIPLQNNAVVITLPNGVLLGVSTPLGRVIGCEWRS